MHVSEVCVCVRALVCKCKLAGGGGGSDTRHFLPRVLRAPQPDFAAPPILEHKPPLQRLRCSLSGLLNHEMFLEIGDVKSQASNT